MNASFVILAYVQFLNFTNTCKLGALFLSPCKISETTIFISFPENAWAANRASLPDPNICTEAIDWNLNIDPALIKEVDREYFTHDAE